MLTVGCIVTILFLFIFIVNQHYIVKVISRYNIRFLNHHHDFINVAMVVVWACVFLFLRFGYHFKHIGPPLVDYESVVPRGNSVFTYYGITNPKVKKDLKTLEMTQDEMLSHFSFVDITKILPYSDTSCPPDGICLDSTQALIKLHMV